MSFPLLILSDFSGECNISQNKYSTTDYDAVIASVEEKILKDLLGEDLYLKVSATPTSYTNLINGCIYSVVNGEGVTVNVNYQGLKLMLKYFTYAELLKHQETENTEVGQVEPLQNNSVRVAKNNLSAKISEAYNKGVKLYGFDIECWKNDNSFICGRRNKPEAKQEYDYYCELVKGTSYNYLYTQRLQTDYLTWQFSEKEFMFINGYL